MGENVQVESELFSVCFFAFPGQKAESELESVLSLQMLRGVAQYV